MKVTVLFFGATAEIVGKRRLDVPLDRDETAGTVFGKVLDKFPALTAHRLLFSINQEYAGGERPVRDGDELAVFTAVSGG